MNHEQQQSATQDESGYSPTIRFPKRVVILGGDLTAWMSATLLAHQFGPLGIQVTVCRDSERRSNDRAVATTSALPALLKTLGIDEHDLLRHCRGSYRLATMFSDWASEGRDFWQPMEMAQLRVGPFPLFDVWLNERKAGRLLRPLHSYSAHWSASLAGKSPHSFAGSSLFSNSGSYGFHIEANSAADWFRGVALQRNVEEVDGTIEKLAPNGRGGIAQAICEGNRAVPGDLFIDCRPADQTEAIFDASSWQSWNQSSGENRAASIQVKGQRQVPVYGRQIAVNNGWLNQLPLADSQQMEFFFHHDQCSDEDAGEAIRKAFALQGNSVELETTDFEFRSLPMGRRENFWKDNVICLGRAACLQDPVTSLEVHFQQAGLEILMELFPDRRIGRATRTEFNQQMSQLCDDCQQVGQLYHHYRHRLPEQTTDSQVQLPALAGLYKVIGKIDLQSPCSVSAEQLRCFLAGCGQLPERAPFAVGHVDANLLQDALRQLIANNESSLKDLPLHEEILDWIHVGPFEQQAG